MALLSNYVTLAAGSILIAMAWSTAATAASVDAKTYCGKLLPIVQPMVSVPLTLARSDDSKSDDLHTGDTAYVDCDFRPEIGQLHVTLRGDDLDKMSNATEKGYAPLPGFRDKARYVVQPQAGMHWVDVVRGSVGCEARFSMPDAQIVGDWKQAGGKICDAALTAH